jgi:hypothetical protein
VFGWFVQLDCCDVVSHGALSGRHAEATAVAFDWALVFDGNGQDFSFEECRALFHACKLAPCVTLLVRFLTMPPVTIRCAPVHSIADVKVNPQPLRGGSDGALGPRALAACGHIPSLRLPPCRR